MKSRAIEDKKRKWKARRSRVNNRIGRTDRARVTLYRSSRHIYVQLREPESGRTIGSVSTRTPGVVGSEYAGGVSAAKKVGEALAVMAKEKNIEKVVFDRNGFLYHGRVKALADAAREAGLQF